MNNVVVGNLCHDPILRQPSRGSQPFAKFTVAVNLRRKVGDEYVDRPPVFHRVVCFGQLAENVTNSLRKGMEVMAVGDWADDSHTDGQGQRHVQIVMEARTLGPTLRWATAQVTRTERRSDTLDMFASDNNREPAPDPTTTPANETTERQLATANPPVTQSPAAGVSVIRGLPTTVPNADVGGSTRRRKKAEPEPAVAQAS